MMRFSHAIRLSIWLSMLALALPLHGQTQNAAASAPAEAPPQQAERFVDGIAAVVNRNVITLGQLQTEVNVARRQLQAQNIAVPDDDTLRRQVLHRMINDELERQEAERMGIRVTDAQVQQAAQSIAERNKISMDNLREEIGKSGMSWETYLENLRHEIRLDQLRQRAVDNKIFISDAEVDAFLKMQARQGGSNQFAQGGAPAQAAQSPQPAPASGPVMVGLAQILVQVPEGASSAQVQELHRKAQDLLAQLRGGADFASVSAASSDAQQALQGGDMGVRPLEGWPNLFAAAVQNLQAGQISDVIRSGNGFHILKVLSRSQGQGAPAPAATAAGSRPPSGGAAQGPLMVTQTHARHILIKTSKVMDDDQARTRLADLRQRILNGEDFGDMARRYSEDTSAPQGGDLGWLTPGETVPAFEQAMDTLQPGQVSEPVHSRFGWHLIQVLDRRTTDMAEEYQRMQARRTLFERRAEPAFEDWLSQLRGQAYIDNRLDPESNRSRR